MVLIFHCILLDTSKSDFKNPSNLCISTHFQNSFSPRVVTVTVRVTVGITDIAAIIATSQTGSMSRPCFPHFQWAHYVRQVEMGNALNSRQMTFIFL